MVMLTAVGLKCTEFRVENSGACQGAGEVTPTLLLHLEVAQAHHASCQGEPRVSELIPGLTRNHPSTDWLCCDCTVHLSLVLLFPSSVPCALGLLSTLLTKSTLFI